jgi:hypothetical protein
LLVSTGGERPPLDPLGARQDGLIDRSYKEKGLRAVWGRCPRAFHAGFLSSYHVRCAPRR